MHDRSIGRQGVNNGGIITLIITYIASWDFRTCIWILHVRFVPWLRSTRTMEGEHTSLSHADCAASAECSSVCRVKSTAQHVRAESAAAAKTNTVRMMPCDAELWGGAGATDRDELSVTQILASACQSSYRNSHAARC